MLKHVSAERGYPFFFGCDIRAILPSGWEGPVEQRFARAPTLDKTSPCQLEGPSAWPGARRRGRDALEGKEAPRSAERAAARGIPQRLVVEDRDRRPR